jgi:isopentenyl-diphosphate delta-isomerase
MEKLILVDNNDNEIGTMEKLEAHGIGALHRAFSILIFREDGEVLLQKRALGKYHCAGLWTDTCSGHPRPGEGTLSAAERRLKEEMGISCKLAYSYKFFYKVRFDNGLMENECDHVFIGTYNDNPSINKDEVHEYKWMNPELVLEDIEKNPDLYAYWSRLCLKEVLLGRSSK